MAKTVSLDLGVAAEPYTDPARYDAAVAKSERDYAELDQALADAREQDE